MAVNAAHLTRTENEKPSIFEVIAQESLQSTIQPALRRIVEFLLSNRQNSIFIKWFDEFYLLFNTVIQYNYLRHYASSFAENFYGLKRISLKSQMFSDGFHLPLKEESLSLLQLIAFPYLRQKLEQLVQHYKYDEMDGLSPKGWRGIYRKVFINFYTFLHTAYEFLCLVQYLAYMSGKSKSHSPLLKILSLSLTYAPNITKTDEATWSTFWNNISSGNICTAKISFGMIGTVFLRTMELSAFFIQFLKWCEDKSTQLNLNSMPIPDAPKPDIRSTQFMNKCPICLQNWKTPTVLSVSGYVFCYKCLIRHLNDESKCPVTKYDANVNDIIRVYV
ncbi:peroxisome assembly protein 12-like [Arctopsyche grandis]|uniref:peroxisome assembly protein 12-like n=1 Tax=Arctopsyche grandis TaxID=121162 RepID=UPI00406D9170